MQVVRRNFEGSRGEDPLFILKPLWLRPDGRNEEKMATKANITMIRNLKNIYNERIGAYFGKKNSEAIKNHREIAEAVHKAVMKDIENYALSKYPWLRKRLKCEYRASNAGVDEISVNFAVETAASVDILKAKQEMDYWAKAETDARRRLEQWEEDAIREAVMKSEIPPFIVYHE